jgi:type II secretory pathway component PulF
MIKRYIGLSLTRGFINTWISDPLVLKVRKKMRIFWLFPLESPIPEKEQVALLRYLKLYLVDSENISEVIGRYGALCHRRYRPLFRRVLFLLRRGHSFSDIVQGGALFSGNLQWYFTLIQQGGGYQEKIDQILNRSMAQLKLKKKVSSKLLYPISLGVMIYMILWVCTLVILPQISGLYTSYDHAIPKFIEIWSVSNLILFSVGSIGFVILARIMYLSLSIANRIKLPLIGSLIKMSLQPKLLTIYEQSLSSEVSFIDLAECVAKTEQSALFKYVLSMIINPIKRGKPLEKILIEYGLVDAQYVAFFTMKSKVNKKQELLREIILEAEERYVSIQLNSYSFLSFVIIGLMGIIVFFIGLMMIVPIQGMVDWL